MRAQPPMMYTIGLYSGGRNSKSTELPFSPPVLRLPWMVENDSAAASAARSKRCVGSCGPAMKKRPSGSRYVHG